MLLLAAARCTVALVASAADAGPYQVPPRRSSERDETAPAGFETVGGGQIKRRLHTQAPTPQPRPHDERRTGANTAMTAIAHDDGTERLKVSAIQR